MTALLNTFTAGDRIRALTPLRMVGTVLHVYDSFGGWLEVQPDGLEHTTIPVYFNDPWQLELLTEVP